jgi:hypothetical protein
LARKRVSDQKSPKADYRTETRLTLKVLGQVNYVVWRDSVVVPSQETGSSGVKGRSRVLKERPDLPASDPGKRIIHKWRKRWFQKVEGVWTPDEKKIVTHRASPGWSPWWPIAFANGQHVDHLPPTVALARDGKWSPW